MQITKNKQDILFGFNYGALEGIEKVFNTLNYDNKIFIFDYGSFNSPKEHYQSYFYLSGIYRKYGGSITVDVNFDAIIALAQSYGLTTQIWSQEEYVSKWLNFTAISNVKKIQFKLDDFEWNDKIDEWYEFDLRKKGTYEEYEKLIEILKIKNMLPSNISYQFIPLSSYLENLIETIKGYLNSLIYRREPVWNKGDYHFISSAFQSFGLNLDDILKKTQSYGFWVLEIEKSQE